MSFDKNIYSGSDSTLCVGCGHDSITSHIISAMHLAQIDPYKLTKLSGIGCSSKTPAYFSALSHGFNSIHGRMAPLATGVHLANHNLKLVGVSGDGDTASIGLGGFIHLLRRNVPMVYIIENNGVYGLTKGQFSATANQASISKTGDINPFFEIDLCKMAITSGAQFVARSFSGDGKQLVPLLRAAFQHQGTAVIDILSPCVTFNNHDRSTMSFDAVKKNKIALQDLGYIEEKDAIELQDGEQYVTLHNGDRLKLKSQSNGQNLYDLSSRLQALQAIDQAHSEGHILTGLLYFTNHGTPLNECLNLSEKPLTHYDKSELGFSDDSLSSLLSAFR